MRKFCVRAAVAALLGGLFGLHVYHDYMKWNRLGVAAYVANQTARFAKFMAHPKPNIFGFAIAALLVAGLYELIVAGVWALAKPRKVRVVARVEAKKEADSQGE